MAFFGITIGYEWRRMAAPPETEGTKAMAHQRPHKPEVINVGDNFNLPVSPRTVLIIALALLVAFSMLNSLIGS